MTHHRVNRDHIKEAFVRKPYKANHTLPINGDYTHGWQVILVMAYNNSYDSKITIDMDSEKECCIFIDNLGIGFIPIP